MEISPRGPSKDVVYSLGTPISEKLFQWLLPKIAFGNYIAFRFFDLFSVSLILLKRKFLTLKNILQEQ